MQPVWKTLLAALAMAVALFQTALHAAETRMPQEPAAKTAPVKGAEVAKAEAARKKPLRRCDELADKAQVECLQKAREQIVAARQKREGPAKGDDKSAVKKPATAQEPSATAAKETKPAKK
jgi:hypothetical protein